jgi:hypothetical protein
VSLPKYTRQSVDRILPVAGSDNVEQIRVAMGPLLHDRPGLAQLLADLQPLPWFTRNHAQ